jgi:hypothetical protein
MAATTRAQLSALRDDVAGLRQQHEPLSSSSNWSIVRVCFRTMSFTDVLIGIARLVLVAAVLAGMWAVSPRSDRRAP